MKDQFDKTYKLDHIEEARYTVSRNLFIFLSVVLGSVGILNLIQSDINFIPLLSGAFLSLICLGILIKFQNYGLAAIVGMFISFGLTVYNISITSNHGHFVDFFWIIVIAIYIFFVLGNRWGVVNLFLNIAAVTVIFQLESAGVIEQVPKPLTPFSQVNFILNIVISGIVFSYITIKVLTALRTSQKNLVQTNKELMKSNEEKTIMLKEIHHRVKNNLQVITSLLRLQLNEIEDEQSRHHFTDSINRVSAMAIIHEKMYQTESLSNIDLASYIQTLIDDLISSYARLTEIETRITSNINHMEPESIVPLALIFNELVSNTLEHGFQNMAHGIISIDVQKSSGGVTTIHYTDNGKWIEPQKEYSFGLELIETFTDQLDGTVRRSTGETGTHYHFEFNKEL